MRERHAYAERDLASIELRKLAKVYPGRIDALRPIDISVHSGELLVLLGPSGSGKSTVLRLIAGLERPSSGTICIDGRDMKGIPPHRRDVAMVFQNPALYPHLSVFNNLAFGAKARGASRAETRTRVNNVAGMLGLDRLLGRRPSALSGGERQRVAIGARSCVSPRSCCSTSRSRTWTSPCGRFFVKRCSSFTAGSKPRSSTSRTTSPKPCSWGIASSFLSTASFVSATLRARSTTGRRTDSWPRSSATHR